MSSAVASVSLSELCFPDITGKTIGAYILVTFGVGTYTTGGIPFGLVAFADQRTVDFNAFLICALYDETSSDASGTAYSFRYIPATDSVLIYANGTELASGASVTITDSVIAHAVWDRTTVRG
jgi:hypothetical protein